jgi:hypothetical protein
MRGARGGERERVLKCHLPILEISLANCPRARKKKKKKKKNKKKQIDDCQTRSYEEEHSLALYV